MAGILADMGAIGKDHTNPQQGFAYRSLDDVMNALHPLLAKYNVYIVPDVQNVERSTYTTKNGSVMQSSLARVAYHFTHTDGSSVEMVGIGEGADSGDKATSKSLAMAYKYALLQGFCIPFSDPDPDGETPEPRAAAAEAGRPAPAPSMAPSVLEQPIGFGRHKARSWLSCAKEHPDWLEWLIESCNSPENRNKARSQDHIEKARAALAVAERGTIDPAAQASHDEVPF